MGKTATLKRICRPQAAGEFQVLQPRKNDRTRPD
jgi:hypothetical protein